ncbi:hypothetical protein [Flavobacterium fluviatile]|uniref:hypothetical protein n=1 Tax=Flavobacterium fluviatile TaxID=1862387 RepID=UPI0013D51F5A|nr:hypothetical protein [Flavobacterium fluviatile]
MGELIFTQKEKEFDLAFKSDGGIWPIKGVLETDNLRIYGSKILEWCRNNGKDLPSCNFNIINDSRVNAKATLFENQYYIGINVGAIACISNLFNRMLSHPEILKQYGDSSKETPPEKIFDVQVIDFDVLKDYITEEKIVIPKDPQRASLARYLTQTCLKTILIHEYAHVKNGHLDYKKSLFSDNSYNEFTQINNLAEGNLMWQALEMDADCIAVNNLIMEAEVLLNHREFIPKTFAEFYTDLENSIYLIYFANYCFYRIFGRLRFSLDNLNNYTHPPAPLRQMMMMATVLRFVEVNFPELQNKIPSMGLEVIEEVENGFNKISEQQIDPSGIMLATTLPATEHVNKILKAWSDIRPLLTPFSKGPLAE